MNSSLKTKIKVALVGNPNCGKTTLFNKLTGSNQYVGNFPGVTVEKKYGRIKNSLYNIEVIDLPGIYSLSAYSQEEIVSRDCILKDDIDVILNIVDATNIERNLYLTTQLMELDCPLVIAVNMMDVLQKRGDQLDFNMLEAKLGVPVVPISASKGIKINKVIEKVIEQAKNKKKKSMKIYSSNIENVLKEIENVIFQNERDTIPNKRFFSVKIFEDDFIVTENFNFNNESRRKINLYKEMIHMNLDMDREMVIADERYRYICSICGEVLKTKNQRGSLNTSDKIDLFLTNKYLAIPIFGLILFFIFFVTFGPFGSRLRDLTSSFINHVLGNFIMEKLLSAGASNFIVDLVVKGIIQGVGTVVSFLPQVAILFTFLSILEDSGYMARGAFIMDHFLRKVGLSGKAFVPLLMGFGCTVPAVLGTRTLENDRDRRLTIMMTPFMSCSAKMPVYALFISTFFEKHQPLVIASIYLFGILIGVLSLSLFKKSFLKGHTPTFVMEMPQYRLPALKNLFLHVSTRVKDFVLKAGTVLMGATIVIWFLQSFDFDLNMVSDSSKSILAGIGAAIAPFFSLCGFGNWKAAVSLLTGIIAKESIVSTMAVLSGGNVFMQNTLKSMFTPLSAYSFMVFVLLYTPCIAALSTIKKEMRSFKWTAFVVVYQIFIAWFASALVFQVGTVFSNINSAIAFAAIIIVAVMIINVVNSIRKGKCVSCTGSCPGCNKVHSTKEKKYSERNVSCGKK